MAALKPAYLFFGGDDVKIGEARRRLAERAAAEGAAFEQFRGDACTPEAVAMAISMPSLLAGSRIVLADGISRWKAAEVGPVADAIASLAVGGEAGEPSDQHTVVVLIGEKKPLVALQRAVEAVGGEIREFKAPTAKALPAWLAKQAEALGVQLDGDAAQTMVDMVGADRPRYLVSELQKLATHAGQGGRISAADVAALGTGDAVPKVFALTDAVMLQETDRAFALARELLDAGERPQAIAFALVRTLGQAQHANAVLSSGGDVAGELGISPWLASKLTEAARLRGETSVEQALVRLARLDRDTKGGNALDDETNLMLALEAIA
jgi:DNA polymerase-3 subunit delta